MRRRANAHELPLSARMPDPMSARDNRDDGNGKLRARSGKGGKWSSTVRRRGRPAHQRSPDDSPLRDGNRDRLIGLLTQRAAKTLEYYFIETNLTYHHWLSVCLFPLALRFPCRALALATQRAQRWRVLREVGPNRA